MEAYQARQQETLRIARRAVADAHDAIGSARQARRDARVAVERAHAMVKTVRARRIGA